MEKIMGIFNDEKLLKDIRSGIALSLALGLGFLYFGFAENITLSALFNFGIGALAVISMISVWIVRIDISFRAFDDEIEENEPLQNDIKSMEDEQDKIIDYDTCIDYIKKYNKQHQELANKIKTEKVIARLESKIVKAKINEKPFTKFEIKISNLKRMPLVDKTYKDITLKQIKGYTAKNKGEFNGLSRVVYNPKTDGNRRSLLFAPLKGFGIGGAGSIPFMVTASGKTIFIYYVLLLLTISLTVITRYLKVRKNTKEKYHIVVKNRTAFIIDMLKHEMIKEEIILEDTTLLLQ